MKKFLSFSLAFLVLCTTVLSAPPPGDPPKQKFELVKQVYTSQIGVTEVPEGSNWGPQVKAYLASVHVYSPAPWCAAFVHWCNSKAGVVDNINAGSPSATNWSHLIYFKNQFLEDPRPADVCTLYFASMGRVGHTFFFDKRQNSKIYRSVEGNTNRAGSREGVEVQYKYRSFRSTHSISRWT